MADTLQKLRPDRDLQCYFLTPTAVAALSGTSSTGFTISGSWRQQFDWTVLEWNRDNTFEHPLFRNLPDGDLSGVTLTYDETRQNCIPIDSNLFPTIDWPTLRIWTDATPADYPYKIPLFPLATAIAGSYVPATATFTLGGTVTAGDYVELAWFDEHYTYITEAGDGLDDVVAAIAGQIASSTTLQATQSGATVTLTCISASGANGNRIGVYGNVAGANTESWSPSYQQLSGGISPTQWQVTLDFSNLRQNPTDVDPIPTNAVRKMRWTYAADLQAGSFARTEFQVAVTNWSVTGTNLTYNVAGPGSCRVEDVAPGIVYTGTWNAATGTSIPQIGTGNFSGGTIHCSTTAGDFLTYTYRAPQTHQLYLGTRKASSGAQVTVVVDGGTPASLNLVLVGEDVLVRLLLGTFSGLTPHTVTATNVDGNAFYFDFLEMAVPASTAPVLAGNTSLTLATDWDTEHSQALAAERTAWMIQALGFTGRANHYAGALWHYELTPQGYTYASGTVTFTGTPEPSLPGAFTSVSIGTYGSTSSPTVIEHLTLFGDTTDSIATAFALLINNGSTAIWAQATGNVLTIYSRAIGAAGNDVTLSASSAMPTLTVPVSGTAIGGGVYRFAGGTDGEWYTDLTVVPRMNRAARDWSRAFFTALAGYGIEATGAFSMELGNGNPTVTAGIAQRYPSGNPVLLNTPALQTNFSPTSTAFWQQAYLDLATLMVEAGQTPYLQFGEVQWWYFPDDGSGMPYYDAYTTSTFEALYGAALTVFTSTNVTAAEYPNETAFLSGLIGTFTTTIMAFVRATYPAAQFEVLYPPDTNDSPLDTAVNLPGSWNPSTLSCFKTENFTFTGSRNLNQAHGSIVLPLQMSFPRNQSAHLVGITGYTTPWLKEAQLSLAEKVNSVVLFALDQFCLMAAPAPLPAGARRALFMGRVA
jgi:hypothetical protein